MAAGAALAAVLCVALSYHPLKPFLVESKKIVRGAACKGDRGRINHVRLAAEDPVPMLRAPEPRSKEEMLDAKVELPSVELLQSKQPLGRSQLTPYATNWLAKEMRWKAQEYIITVEQETLGFLAVSEEAQLLRALGAFSASSLQAHLRLRLGAHPLKTSEGRAGAELAARHPPTVWAAFQLAVQQRLQERSVSYDNEGVAVDTNWRQDLEWVILPHIRDPSKGLVSSLPATTQIFWHHSTPRRSVYRKTTDSGGSQTDPAATKIKDILSFPAQADRKSVV